MADEPAAGLPVALAPPTFDRHETATQYVEQIVRTRRAPDSRQRFPGLAPAAWGLVEPGSTITGADLPGGDLTLGEGDVTLYVPDPDNPHLLIPRDPEDTAHVYNSGEEIAPDAYGDGVLVELLWINGQWVIVGGGGGGGSLIDCVIADDVPPAVWDPGGGYVTAADGGGYQIDADGNVTGTLIAFKNRYPNGVTAPRFVKLERKPNGEYHLVVSSCSTVPAPPYY